ncbi:MAG: methylmalonyl Co-A mutase-associated GTPase MeaB [Rhodospirillaceae bacterium TMED8]|mgnify:CR=1 FL=1|nr:methylmalonyl Co-A mutase-associated GTPase MeaB [Magnetovibrio sp.]OUT51986.1 MAG: methylmalonyl Co-A mutase-associated GTPase MeaB [Rhodospirillaceae bacterium TMED8]
MNFSQTAESLLDRVLKGETRAMARMMSFAESSRDDHRVHLGSLYKYAGHAHVVGLTGVPGSGKSTLARCITLALRETGKRVGIVAVDPSSPFSGGAILGDRVRMGDLATDSGVFIRSLATRGSLGGLARAALDTADIMDAAGFDIVLIETVGVGQDEIDIATAAHTVIVTSAPGLGDGIQAIKAGVLEIADVHVVAKSDRPDAERTLGDLNAMLNLGLAGRGLSEWAVPVIATSAETGDGVYDLVRLIDEHFSHLKQSGELFARRKKIAEMRVLKAAEDIVRERIQLNCGDEIGPIFNDVFQRKIDPLTAAKMVLKRLNLVE